MYRTAFAGFLSLGICDPAFAACDTHTPSNGAVVTCAAGTDTTGISGNANNVNVAVNAGASINTTGTSAIDLGTGATITVTGNGSVASNVTTIMYDGGSIGISSTSGSITSSSGTAIQYTGAAGTSAAVTITGSISGGGGTAIDFGNGNASLTLLNGYSITGNVVAGAGSNDAIRLSGTGTFNVSDIGTKYTGFDSFQKVSTGTWTLTGSGNQNWTINNGALQGDTTSIQGNVSNGGSLIFNQNSGGLYSSVISGVGTLTKSGNGTVTLSGNNTYTGGTTVSAGALSVSSDDNLGSGSLTLNGGSLEYGASFDSARNIALGAGNGTIDTNGHDSALSGIISGGGSLIKAGSGTLTLTGTNTYTGGAVVSAGRLAGNSSSIKGNISNGSELEFAQGSNGEFSGAISGAGNVYKSGSGTLTLSGANNYTGDTIIEGGAISISSDGNLGSSGDLRLDGGTIVYDAGISSARDIVLGPANGAIDTNGSNSTLSGVISGVGDLNKKGAGDLTLSGTNTYLGDTTVSGGRLSVDGTIGGTATVNSGAELGGNGTVGNIVNNGMLSPGNSIGTLNAAGNVTFNAGSTYKVEVDDAGDSDKIISTGALHINGGRVDVRAASGTYADTTNYTILQGASRTGTFSSVTSDLAFLDPSLTYTSSNVVLHLTRNDSSFNIVAQDHVQEGVADAVEELGAGNSLYQSFVGLNAEEAGKALNTLSGEHNVGLTVADVASQAAVRNVVFNRIQAIVSSAQTHLSGLSSGQSAADPSMVEPAAGDGLSVRGERAHVWSDFFGTTGHMDAQSTAPSQNHESGGVLVGADKSFGDYTGGIFLGWERGEVYTDSQFANSDVRTTHAGVYGSWKASGPLRLSTGLIGSYHDIDTTRHISFNTFDDTAKGDTDGFTTSAFLEGAYAVNAGDNTSIEPYAGIGVTYSYVGSYKETEGGDADLAVDSASQLTPSHTLGVRAAHGFTAFRNRDMQVRGRIGWEHNYGDLESKSDMRFLAGSTSFEVLGPSTARDSATVGAGLQLALPYDAVVYTDYDGSYSKDSINHGLTLGVKVSF